MLQQLPAAYTASNSTVGKLIEETVPDMIATCPIPEVARLGRTLRGWRPHLLAYFATNGVSNGGAGSYAIPAAVAPYASR